MSFAKQSILIVAIAFAGVNLFLGSALFWHYIDSPGPQPEVSFLETEGKLTKGSVLASLGGIGDNVAPSHSSPYLFKNSPPTALAGSGIIEYTVQLHDNPSTIASRFGLTTETILAANDLKYGEAIFPGDKLKILPVSGVLHKVQTGETLKEIAQKYEASQEQIAEFLVKPGLTVESGREIIIPGGSKDIGRVPTIVQKEKIGNYFINPTQGQITQQLHSTNAIDIGNDCGTPIFAAAGGIVTRIKWGPRAGYYILVKHPNGLQTFYAHLSKMFVQTGAQVKQGQKIALIGTTGNSTGCHLHFSVHGGANPLARFQIGDWVK